MCKTVKENQNHWLGKKDSPTKTVGIWGYDPIKSLTIHAVLLVAQSCPALCNPMDCSLPVSFVHGDSPGNNTGVGCHALL